MPNFQLPANSVRPTIKVELDGTLYVLKFRWNMRSGWYLDFLDSSEDPIFVGRKVTPDWDLLRRVTDPRRPTGLLILQDETGLGEPPTRENLASRYNLWYASLSEIEELLA